MWRKDQCDYSGQRCGLQCAPMWCQGKGAKGQVVQAILHDAQGATIPSAGSRRLEIACKTHAGEPVVFKEEFVIGNVQNPLMSLGRLMRRGWTLATQNGQHFLSGGKAVVPKAKHLDICAVDSVENPAGPVPEGLQEIKFGRGALLAEFLLSRSATKQSRAPTPSNVFLCRPATKQVQPPIPRQLRSRSHDSDPRKVWRYFSALQASERAADHIVCVTCLQHCCVVARRATPFRGMGRRSKRPKMDDPTQ